MLSMFPVSIAANRHKQFWLFEGFVILVKLMLWSFARANCLSRWILQNKMLRSTSRSTSSSWISKMDLMSVDSVWHCFFQCHWIVLYLQLCVCQTYSRAHWLSESLQSQPSFLCLTVPLSCSFSLEAMSSASPIYSYSIQYCSACSNSLFVVYFR